jgi:UDP-hydrolysing UDP-N-acetyl-D-glucosamine 2-epimerase
MTIAVIITARPSYARIKTVITALIARGVEVHILACASALLERYGKVVDVIRQDFPHTPITECWSTYEGANLVTSIKETAALAGELAGVLLRQRPDSGIVIADRHEVLAAGQALAYLHIPLIHIQGGERTGSIDDKVRDSITQLADVHFVATRRAKHRVYGLTGEWDTIHVMGCPSVDLAKQALSEPPVTVNELGGSGASFDLKGPFVVWLQHPVTSEVGDAERQASETGIALHLRMSGASDVLALWPGEDAGADAISKVIRRNQEFFHTARNLPPTRFLRLLTQASCLVGNSSVGIREASYLGVPVVNIGTRQQGRERGPNVLDVPHDAVQIAVAIQRQIAHGRYPSSSLYGSGDAGEKIADVLCEAPCLS